MAVETHGPTFDNSVFTSVAVRAFDIAVASVGVVLCAIAIVFLVPLNFFFNPGKLFYTQERVGLNGKIFTIYKFRTMTPGNGGIGFATDHSHRITPFGGFLRKYRIDEWPQFFNVLIGNMSFVGPRPEQVEFVKQYTRTIPFYANRLRVKPGMTGLAQVKLGYTDSAQLTAKKSRLDSFYIERRSLLLNIYITFATVKVLISGKGI